jgi:hypothetical protein
VQRLTFGDAQIDWRIMLWAWVMFVALDIHRKNINRAISDNMVRPDEAPLRKGGWLTENSCRRLG